MKVTVDGTVTPFITTFIMALEQKPLTR